MHNPLAGLHQGAIVSWKWPAPAAPFLDQPELLSALFILLAHLSPALLVGF
jgi:hypothetical protein